MPQRQTITLHSLQFLFEYCLFEHLKQHRIIHKEWAKETVSHQYFKLGYQIKRNSRVLLQLNICRFDTTVWQFRGVSLFILIVLNILYVLPVDAILIFINFLSFFFFFSYLAALTSFLFSLSAGRNSHSFAICGVMT